MTESKINTSSENKVIYFTKLHWIIFFGPVLAFVLVTALCLYFPQIWHLCLIFIVFCLVWLSMTWATYYFSSITIKRRQVILRTGIIVRQTVDIPLSKIETIDIRQSITGSILRYGTLVITGTGGTRHLINYLQKPLTCRRYIEQLMNEL